MTRRFLILSLILAPFMMLTAVGPAAAQNSMKLRVGVMKIAALADAFLAEQQGLFKKHNLDVDLVVIRSGAEGITALQGGDIDITLAIPGFALAANERRFKLVMVFQNELAHATAPDSGGIVVRKDADIKALSGLVGKTVGVNSLHAQEAVDAQYLIRKAGVAEGKVRYVEVPFPSMADALDRKHVDAVVAIDPFTTMIQQRGIGRVIAWEYVDSIPEQPIGTFWAKRDWAEKNGKALDAFAAAMEEAMAYLNADAKRARNVVAKFTGLPPKLVEAMPMIVWSSKVDPAKWRELIALLRSQRELQKDHEAADYFAPRILRQIGHKG